MFPSFLLASCTADQYVSTDTVGAKSLLAPATPTTQNYCVICLHLRIFHPSLHSAWPPCACSSLLLSQNPHKTLLLPGPVALTGSKERVYGKRIRLNIYLQVNIFVSFLGSAIYHHDAEIRSVCVSGEWAQCMCVYDVYKFTHMLFTGSLDANVPTGL